MSQDSELTQKVKEALSKDERTAQLEVHVKVVGGVAFLDGHADDEDEKQAATEVTKAVEGIRFVQNRLHVGAEHRTRREVMREQGR